MQRALYQIWTGLAPLTVGASARGARLTDLEDLRETLEIACLDALGGGSPGPLMASRLRRSCEDVLRSRGIRAARVQVRSDASGTAVTIVLAPPGARVRRLVLQLH